MLALWSNLLAQSSEPPGRRHARNNPVAQGKCSSADAFYAPANSRCRHATATASTGAARGRKHPNESVSDLAGRLALNLNAGNGWVHSRLEIQPDDHDLALAYADLLATHWRRRGRRTSSGNGADARRVPVPLCELAHPSGDRRGSSRLLTPRLLRPRGKGLSTRPGAEGWLRAARPSNSTARSRGRTGASAALRRAELLAQQGHEQARSELAELRLQPSELAVEESWLAEARILRDGGP